MVTKEEVLNIANLSKLYLTPEELDDAFEEMKGIVKFVNQINEIQDLNEEINYSDELSNALREDEIIQSFPRKKILENVEGGKEGFFYLEKSQ